MNDLEKQKHKERLAQELLLIQKYFYSPEWNDIRSDIEYQLEITETYLGVDNHLIPELTESYNSIVQRTVEILEGYVEQISMPLVVASLEIAINHNKEKFNHFPGLGESRDTKRYSKKDLYRAERQTYLNMLQMEKAYIKNIGQGKEENDNTNEGGLDSQDLWSGIGFSSQG